MDEQQQIEYWGPSKRLPTPEHLPAFSHMVSGSFEHPEQKARKKCLQVKQTMTREEISGGRCGGHLYLSSSRLLPSRNAG